MKRLGRLGQGLSLIAGSCLGTLCFLVIAVVITAKPIRESILSAHGILVSSKALEITPEQSALIVDLLQKGALVSSNDLLTNVSSFYSTMIQVLIATFFVFGALSLFAVQANARRQIEDLADIAVTKAAVNHFQSVGFDKQVRDKVDSSLQIELEAYEDRIVELEQVANRVHEIEARLVEQAKAVPETEE